MPVTAKAAETTPRLNQFEEACRVENQRAEITMLRVQTKALETLERLMDDPEPTGDEKKDAERSRERNRQRLAANQALIHCRTMAREERLARTTRKQAEGQASEAPASIKESDLVSSTATEPQATDPAPAPPEPSPDSTGEHARPVCSLTELKALREKKRNELQKG
ncbi:MAG: hypothetical protein ACNA8P_07225 [Phycisphaerales bacterium]